MKKSVITLILTLGCLFSTVTYAWRIVFDPSNYSKNLITSAQMIINEVNQLKQIEQQVLANAKGVVGDQSGVFAQLASIRSTMASLQQLRQSVGEGSEAWRNIQGVFAAGNYQSWDEYTNIMAKRKEAGDVTAKVLFESSKAATDSMESATEGYRRVLQKSDSISGATEGAQAIVQSVGVLVQQNRAITAALAAQNNQAGLELTKSNQQEANALAEKRAYDQARERANQEARARYGLPPANR